MRVFAGIWAFTLVVVLLIGGGVGWFLLVMGLLSLAYVVVSCLAAAGDADDRIAAMNLGPGYAHSRPTHPAAPAGAETVGAPLSKIVAVPTTGVPSSPNGSDASHSTSLRRACRARATTKHRP